MRYLILLLAAVSSVWHAQTPGRYQTVVVPDSSPAVFVVDTATGEVRYCFAYNDGAGKPAKGVICVSSKK